MIAQVIQSQQLGRYNERTFPAAIDGHRVHQVAFTKFVLHRAGICSVPLLFDTNTATGAKDDDASDIVAADDDADAGWAKDDDSGSVTASSSDAGASRRATPAPAAATPAAASPARAAASPAGKAGKPPGPV